MKQTITSDSSLGNFTYLTNTKQVDFGVTTELLDEAIGNPKYSAEDNEIIVHMRDSLNETGKLPYQWTQQEAHFFNSNPPELWVDYLVYRYKFKLYPKQKKIAAFPVHVLIEPVSVCNLRCIMCYQIDNTFRTKEHMGLMDVDLFRRLVDEAAEKGTKGLTMAARGEPLMHSRFEELVTHVGDRFFEFKINTNATRLTEKLAHVILSSGIDELVFSVDYHEKELYERIRVRADFDQVLKNIARFNEIRLKEYPNTTLKTRVSGVFFDPEQSDVEGFSRFWGDYVDDVGTVHMRNQWDTYNNPAHPERDNPCHFLWERVYIWQDGTVNPCELDYKSTLAIGKATERTVMDIWHGEEMTRLREQHLAGNRSTLVPCDRCGV